MGAEAETDDAGADDLPASMADMFFALVAIVIFLLLALAPSVRAGLPAPPAVAPPSLWQSDIRIENRRPAIIVAEAEGLRIEDRPLAGSAGEAKGRLVGLDAILDDEGLAATLRTARRDGTPILIGIEDRGQEAAFLFDALARGLDLPQIYQLRIEPGCGHVLDAGLLAACRTEAASGKTDP